MRKVSQPSFPQRWERRPSQLLLFQTVRRVSQPVVGGAGFKPACPPPAAQTHTQMGWELVFWDARAPDSALGILAECVLGNVRPTGNRGLPLTPSRRWAGSRERESREYERTGAQCARG